MARHYREFFATPGVWGLVIAGTIARLTYAMIGIGLITMLVLQTGHYGLAGAVAGIFTLSNALIAPQVSKLVDRRGEHRVLPVVTAFSIAMLLALIMAAYLRFPAPVLFILAVLAGTMPSMSAMIRARWTRLFRGTTQLHTAFSLDTVLAELTFIIGGPLAIGLSSGLFPEAGPLVALLLLACGVTCFLLQRQTAPDVVTGSERSGASVLRIPGLGIIILALLLMGVIGGTVDVVVVAFANEQGWPTAASFMLAAYALGSLASGLVFGGLRIGMAVEKQFFLGIILTALTSILPIFSLNVYMMAGMLFVAGMSFAPTMIIAMNLGSAIIAPAQITEGLTWMSTGIGIGVAFGAAMTGLVVDGYGGLLGFGVAITAGFAMVFMVLLGLGSLRGASALASKAGESYSCKTE